MSVWSGGFRGEWGEGGLQACGGEGEEGCGEVRGDAVFATNERCMDRQV